MSDVLSFLAGLLSPFVLAGLLAFAVRQFAGGGEGPPPAATQTYMVVVLVATVVAAVLLWGRARPAALGLITALVVAALMTFVFVMRRSPVE